MSLKAILFPLLTILSISGVLIYYTGINKQLISTNNKNIESIVDNQGDMIQLFLSTPSLQVNNNPTIKNGVKTFKQNIGSLKKVNSNSKLITKNGNIIYYFVIVMTIVQTMVIFALFIFFTHKISGPIHVITNYLREIRRGNFPKMRSLRKRDELQGFYGEFKETIEYLESTYQKKGEK